MKFWTAPRAMLAGAITLALIVGWGCMRRYDRQPPTRMIEAGYFSCGKCGSLSGGIFGTGPTRHFRAPQAGRCVHDWQTISYDEFKAAATADFGVDWSQEIPFWNR